MSQIERAKKHQEERAAQLLAQIELRARLRPKTIAIAVGDALREYGRWLKTMRAQAPG